jgi:hypothetical protein
MKTADNVAKTDAETREWWYTASDISRAAAKARISEEFEYFNKRYGHTKDSLFHRPRSHDE